jgi:hypothetical protein
VLASTRSTRTVAPTTFSGGPAHSGRRRACSSGPVAGISSKKLMCASIPGVDAPTVVFGGLLLCFVVTVLPEIDEQEIERRVREDRDEIRRWRES